MVMPKSNLILGSIALVTLLVGMASGIAFGPRISEPLGDVEGLFKGFNTGFFSMNLEFICKKRVYKNDTLDIDSIKEIIVRVGSGKASITQGEPRIVVYTLSGVFCNINPSKPRWSVDVENDSLIVELNGGILELYIPASQLESLDVRVESGIVDVWLDDLPRLEESRVKVESGIVNINLKGLSRLSNYTVKVESGVTNIDLDFRKTNGGDVYIDVSSGQLNMDINGYANACLASSFISSGFASIDLPSKCTTGDLRVHVRVSSGIASIE